MKRKTKYLIPAIVAVFALTLVFANPYVMAEGGDYAHAKWGAKHHGMKHVIVAEGFVGAIPLPDEFSKESMHAIKNDIKITLRQALSAAEADPDFDADAIKMAGVGIVLGQDDKRFVAWNLVSMTIDEEAQTATANIFVVDAGAESIETAATAKVTKEFDPTAMDRMPKHHYGKAKFQNLDEDTKAELKTAFQNLKNARATGDQAQIDDAKETLKSLFESIKAQN